MYTYYVFSIAACIDAIVLITVNIEHRWMQQSGSDVKEMVYNMCSFNDGIDEDVCLTWMKCV